MSFLLGCVLGWCVASILAGALWAIMGASGVFNDPPKPEED